MVELVLVLAGVDELAPSDEPPLDPLLPPEASPVDPPELPDDVALLEVDEPRLSVL